MAKIFEKISPCKDCPDRQILCHSQCGKYTEWLATGKSDKAPLWSNSFIRKRIIKNYYKNKTK